MKTFQFKLGTILLAGSMIFSSCEKEEVTTNEEEVQVMPTTKDQASSGYGGSLSQFTIVDNYLYTIDYRTLNIFLLDDAENPAAGVLQDAADNTFLPAGEKYAYYTQNLEE